MKKLMMKARKGATFIEYAMLAGLVAIVVAVAAMFFGDQLKALFTTTGAKTQQVNTAISGVELTPDVTKPSSSSSSSSSSGSGS